MYINIITGKSLIRLESTLQHTSHELLYIAIVLGITHISTLVNTLLSCIINDNNCALVCGSPQPPANGRFEKYINFRNNLTVTYQCNDGYHPSAPMNAVCTPSGDWVPVPKDHSCTLVECMLAIITFIHDKCHY